MDTCATLLWICGLGHLDLNSYLTLSSSNCFPHSANYVPKYSLYHQFLPNKSCACTHYRVHLALLYLPLRGSRGIVATVLPYTLHIVPETSVSGGSLSPHYFLCIRALFDGLAIVSIDPFGVSAEALCQFSSIAFWTRI